MPELDPQLDAELAGLRDGLRGAVRQPEIGLVVTRFRQRRARRRMQVGAAVAVLVVSAVVPLLRTQLPPTTSASPPVSTSPPRIWPDEPFIHDVGFADPEHGFALRADCSDQIVPSRPDCELELLATADGEHWTATDVPVPDNLPVDHPGQLLVFGPSEVAVEWYSGLYTANLTRLHSVDAGRTWRTVPIPSVATDVVAAIPNRGVLVSACAELVGGGQICARRGFVVVSPGTGASARLANQPPLEDPVPGPYPTAGERWWVVGREPGTRSWALAVSEDDGRSWRTSTLDWPKQSTEWQVVADGDTLYASAVGSEPTAPHGLLGIFRSDDGGRTWTRTWQRDHDHELVAFHGALVAAEDGTLTATGFGPDTATYTSTDGGRTLVEAERGRPGPVVWTRAGYVAGAEGRYELSADGVDWRRYEIPLE